MPGGPAQGSARGGAPGAVPHGAASGGAGPNGTGRSAVGGAQLGPVGRWWDDRSFARSLNIRAEQKQRMDAVFDSNRSELMGRYQELKVQQARLDEATRETRISGSSVFAQINRVAEAREALGAVNARMTKELLKELDPEQLGRLQAIK